MNKLARKPSTDPLQEKLRKNKEEWNEEVSSLIDDIIHFKKLVNGKPGKFFNEKSKIIEPIPANPSKILDQLAGKYNTISQKGMSIARQQAEYSKNRKKKEKKASFDSNYLISEGSNVLTRTWTRLTNPAFGSSPEARIVRYRKGMLNTLADLYRDLKKFERNLGRGYVITLTPSKEKVKEAKQMFNKIQSNWNMLLSAFVEFNKDNQLPATNTSEENLDGYSAGNVDPLEQSIISSEIENKNQKVENINSWLQEAFDNELYSQCDQTSFVSLLKKIQSYQKNNNPKNIDKIYNQIIGLFRQCKQELEVARQIKESQASKSAATQNNQLPPVLAFFSGIIGPVSRDIIKLSEEVRSDMNVAMDSLEAGMDTNTLQRLFKSIADNMSRIRDKMNRVVNSFLRGVENIDSYTSLLESGDITGSPVKLTDKDKKSLISNLRRQRMSELGKLYRGA